MITILASHLHGFIRVWNLDRVAHGHNRGPVGLKNSSFGRTSVLLRHLESELRHQYQDVIGLGTFVVVVFALQIIPSREIVDHLSECLYCKLKIPQHWAGRYNIFTSFLILVWYIRLVRAQPPPFRALAL